jgi:hypothetical protein
LFLCFFFGAPLVEQKYDLVSLPFPPPPIRLKIWSFLNGVSRWDLNNFWVCQFFMYVLFPHSICIPMAIINEKLPNIKKTFFHLHTLSITPCHPSPHEILRIHKGCNVLAKAIDLAFDVLLPLH